MEFARKSFFLSSRLKAFTDTKSMVFSVSLFPLSITLFAKKYFFFLALKFLLEKLQSMPPSSDTTENKKFGDTQLCPPIQLLPRTKMSEIT